MDEQKAVGKCERCGREFITMPNDNRDHGGFKGKECRGRVIEIEKASDLEKLKLERAGDRG